LHGQFTWTARMDSLCRLLFARPVCTDCPHGQFAPAAHTDPQTVCMNSDITQKVCAGSLCRQFAWTVHTDLHRQQITRTVHADCLREQFTWTAAHTWTVLAPTAHMGSLCQQFTQAAHTDSLCRLLTWSVCADCLHGLLAQTACTNCQHKLLARTLTWGVLRTVVMTENHPLCTTQCAIDPKLGSDPLLAFNPSQKGLIHATKPMCAQKIKSKNCWVVSHEAASNSFMEFSPLSTKTLVCQWHCHHHLHCRQIRAFVSQKKNKKCLLSPPHASRSISKRQQQTAVDADQFPSWQIVIPAFECPLSVAKS